MVNAREQICSSCPLMAVLNKFHLACRKCLQLDARLVTLIYTTCSLIFVQIEGDQQFRDMRPKRRAFYFPSPRYSQVRDGQKTKDQLKPAEAAAFSLLVEFMA